MQKLDYLFMTTADKQIQVKKKHGILFTFKNSGEHKSLHAQRTSAGFANGMRVVEQGSDKIHLHLTCHLLIIHE
jgi:hypothetical protein